MQTLATWEETKAVVKWKSSLKQNSKKRKLSKSTLIAIRFWMPLYLEYTQKTPDELITEANTGIDVVPSRLTDFFNWLQDEKNKKYNMAITGAYGSIAGFYKNNDVVYRKIRSPVPEPTQVEFTDDQLPLFDIVDCDDGVRKKRKVLKKKLINDVYAYLSPRDYLIVHCLLSSGLDDIDLLNLPLALIRYTDANFDRILIRVNRSKTGERTSTFFNKIATTDLRNYVFNYRKDGADTDPIWIQHEDILKIQFRKKYDRPFNPDIDTLDVMPVTPENIADNVRTAVKQYNIYNPTTSIILQKGKQSPLRPKRNRKIFGDAADDAGVPTDIKRIFMGKKDDGNKPYPAKSREDLEMYYEMMEDNLCLNDIEIVDRSDEIQDLKNSILELKMMHERDQIKYNSEKQEFEEKIENLEKITKL